MNKGLVAAALAVVFLPACRASVNVNAKASTESEPTEAAEGAPAPEPPPVVLETAYFGVARSLTLKPGQRTPTCACVDVVVGPANGPEFEWHGEAPPVGQDALVVAISAEGAQCEAKGRGPSIAAIDRVDNDVVVVLEEFKETRPLALGAIIPNPGPGGSVYLRPRGKVPYGRPLAATAGSRRNLCLVGRGTEGATLSAPERTVD